MGHLNCTAKFRPGRHLTSAKDLSFCFFVNSILQVNIFSLRVKLKWLP